MLVGCLACLLLAQSAQAALYEWEGTSLSGTDVKFQADLTISGSTLTVSLYNVSPVPSDSKDDVLSSFYFDIVNSDGTRPTLTYQDATGSVYLARKTATDVLQSFTDIRVYGEPGNVQGRAESWAFIDGNPGSFPYLNFGIGTIGNNTPIPGTTTYLITDSANQFNGNLVDGVNYSIYHGDAATSSLNNLLLVRDMATFEFGITGLSLDGYSLGNVGFGLGSGPDSFHVVPVPAAVLLGMLGFGVAGLKLRKYV